MLSSIISWLPTASIISLFSWEEEEDRLSALPDELKEMILSHMRPADLATTARLSERFHQLASAHLYSGELDLRDPEALLSFSRSILENNWENIRPDRLPAPFRHPTTVRLPLENPFTDFSKFLKCDKNSTMKPEIRTLHLFHSPPSTLTSRLKEICSRAEVIHYSDDWGGGTEPCFTTCPRVSSETARRLIEHHMRAAKVTAEDGTVADGTVTDGTALDGPAAPENGAMLQSARNARRPYPTQHGDALVVVNQSRRLVVTDRMWVNLQEIVGSADTLTVAFALDPSRDTWRWGRARWLMTQLVSECRAFDYRFVGMERLDQVFDSARRNENTAHPDPRDTGNVASLQDRIRHTTSRSL